MNQQPRRFYILIGVIVLQDLIQGAIVKAIPLIVCSALILLSLVALQFMKNKFKELTYLLLLIFFVIQIYYYSSQSIWFLICTLEQFVSQKPYLQKISKITLLVINVILNSIQYDQQLQYSLFQSINYCSAFCFFIILEKPQKQSQHEIAKNNIIQELQKSVQFRIFNNNLQDYSQPIIQQNECATYQQITNRTQVEENHSFYIKIHIDQDLAGSPSNLHSQNNMIFYDCKQFIEHLHSSEIQNNLGQYNFIATQIENHIKTKYKVSYDQIENGKFIVLSFTKIDSFLMKLNKEKLNKFKKEFYNIFAHKLKTPLNTCLGFLYQTYHNSDVGSEIREKFIKPAYINSKLQYFQISDLLEYLNPQVDQTSLQRCKINMKTFLLDLTELIELQCRNKNILFQVAVDAKKLDQTDIIYITQDVYKLERVLYNLLNLSYRYTPSNGNIKLHLKINQEECEVEFKISGSGVGFSAEEIENLNCWIKHKDKTQHQAKQLFIKKELRMTLDITNNLINLLSEQEQTLSIEQTEFGTMFHFKIPILESRTADVSQEQFSVGLMLKQRSLRNMKSSLNNNNNSNNNNNVSLKSIFSGSEPLLQHLTSQKVIDEPSANIPLTRKVNSSPQKKKQNTIKRVRSSIMNKCIDSDKSILIVDDEPFNHDTLILMLKSLGYKNFLKAFNGQQAIEIAKEQEFDISIILMDLDMPIMGGLEATEILVKLMFDQELNYIPIIGCTAHDDKETVDKCFEVGMLLVVQKPVFIKTLREAFAQIFTTEEFKRKTVLCFTSQLQI